jgi:hypothetical protein
MVGALMLNVTGFSFCIACANDVIETPQPKSAVRR